MNITIEFKPLRELSYGDSFQDEYGNRYQVSDEEDEGGTSIYYTPIGSSDKRFLGKITREGTYRKFEEERHRYQKENAWTVNQAILKRADKIEYHTHTRVYSIDVPSAMSGGKKVTLNQEPKWVIPIKYWQVTSSNPVENRRLQLIGTEWTDRLTHELDKDYMKQVAVKVNAERKSSTVYPANQDVFKAFKLTNYSDVKVVVLGQDPYPADYANGLAFGINDAASSYPYSLTQLFAELDRNQTDKGFLPTAHEGSLEAWASQGVLLLNTRLTVGSKPGSHANFGWEEFTKHVIEDINRSPLPIVFMLWGTYAGSYAHLIDSKFHRVLHAPHPAASSHATYSGPSFVGCNHFEVANDVLRKTRGISINW